MNKNNFGSSDKKNSYPVLKKTNQSRNPGRFWFKFIYLWLNWPVYLLLLGAQIALQGASRTRYWAALLTMWAIYLPGGAILAFRTAEPLLRSSNKALCASNALLKISSSYAQINRNLLEQMSTASAKRTAALVMLFGVTVLLLFSGACLGDPANQGHLPRESFTLKLSTGSSLEQEATGLPENTGSLDCAFHDFKIGLWAAVLSPQKPDSGWITPSGMAMLQALQDPSRNIRLAFDRNDKCDLELSFYLLYQNQIDELFKKPSPQARANALRSLYGDCKAKTVPEIYRQLPLEIAQTLTDRLIFANIGGKMQNSFCLHQDQNIFSLPRPGASAMIKISGAPPQLVKTLRRELNGYSQNLSGSLKKAQQSSPPKEPELADFAGLKIGLFFGPQEKPLDIVTTYLGQAESLDYFTSGFPPGSQSAKLTDAIEALIRSGKRVHGYHRYQGAWEAGSFFQKMFGALDASAFQKSDGPVQLLPVKTKNHSSHFHLFQLQAADKNLLLLYNGCLSYSCLTGDDTALWVIEVPQNSPGLESVAAFFAALEKESTPPALKNPPVPGGVVVTEIVWMGTMETNQSSHTTDEMIELYNRTTSAANIGGWIISCTSDPLGQTADMIAALPPGLTIEPHSYLTLAKSRNYAFTKADVQLGDLKFLNATRECLLIDPSAPGALWPPSAMGGHYSNPALQGTVIDRVLNHTGAPFNRYGSQHFSRTGVSRPDGVYSMERLSPEAPGEMPSSWQSHYGIYGTPDQPAYLFHTHHSAGGPSSAGPQQEIFPGEIIVSEINWMGSYDNLGVSHSGDEYVEFYNNTNHEIDMGRLLFGCSSDALLASGALLFSFAPGTLVPAQDYFTVYRKGALAYSALNPGKTSSPSFQVESFSLTNTTRQCLLTGGKNNTVHYGEPLLTGPVIDTVSDGSATFSSLQIGTNNTAGKLRQSAERPAPWLPGELPSSWSPASTSTGINPAYQGSTWGTPGLKNSFW